MGRMSGKPIIGYILKERSLQCFTFEFRSLILSIVFINRHKR